MAITTSFTPKKINTMARSTTREIKCSGIIVETKKAGTFDIIIVMESMIFLMGLMMI